jgi:hypothetical protein
LTRPGTIAADITLTSREPTLALCRALIDAGHASDAGRVDRQGGATDGGRGQRVPVPPLAAAGGRLPVCGALQEWPLTMRG